MRVEELCKRIFEEHKERIFDIIRAERGIWVLTRGRDFLDEIEREFASFEREFKIGLADIFSIFEERDLLRGLLGGVSLVYEEPLASRLGLKVFMEYRYSLENLNQSGKMMFNYALEGRRGMKGILHRLGGMKVARAVVLIPKKSEGEFEDFLQDWGVGFKKRLVLYEVIR
jgi:hypothetical protein